MTAARTTAAHALPAASDARADLDALLLVDDDPLALVGATVATVERRRGFLVGLAPVRVDALVGSPVGDLAVADRLAYVASLATSRQHAVVARDGWHQVVRLDTELPNVAVVHPAGDDARLESLASARGIVPLVG